MITTAFSLDFVRALGPPAITGILRAEPEDFVVVENLGFLPSGEGEHIYLQIEKRGANTAWVAAGLASFLRVRVADVSYSGRKDRHAVTTQWFSCWLPGTAAPDWHTLAIEGVRVLASSRHAKKLRRGMHVGNRFVLRLRSVAGGGDEVDLAHRIRFIREYGFPNYFGEQRFGHGANNLHSAAALFAGRRVDRRKRDIFISAARSYLFNQDLSARIADGRWQLEPHGWLAGEHRVPLPAGDHEVDALGWRASLERLRVKAMRRPWRVIPQDLAVSQEESGLLVTFTLPTGSYATSLLREFVDYNGGDSTDHEEGDQTVE